MKISRVKAVNFEGVVNIDVLLGKNVNKITGKNGAGKSSFKDSIIATLCGAKYTPDIPIRTGQNKAEVTVDMGEYIVKGTYTKAGRKIEVLSPDGAKFPRHQELLDKAIGKLSFDPTDFYRKTQREQTEMLRELVGLDVSDIVKKYQQLQVERAQINSNKTLLQQKVDGIIIPLGTPNEEVSIVNLSTKLQKAIEHNNNVEQQLQERNQIHAQTEEVTNKITELAETLDSFTKQSATFTKIPERINIEALQIKIDAAEETLRLIRQEMKEAMKHNENVFVQTENRKQLNTKVVDITNKIEASKKLLTNLNKQGKKLLDIPDTYNVEEMQTKIETTEAINRNVHLKKQKEELLVAIDKKTNEYSELGRTMKSLDATKADRLAEIKMPVDGLSLTEEYVTYGDLPLKQVNTGEQLKIAVAIAMAMNPTLKTIFVRCNDLDSDNLKILEDMIIEHDYQGFIELADTSGKIGIVIEDGMIKNKKAKG